MLPTYEAIKAGRKYCPCKQGKPCCRRRGDYEFGCRNGSKILPVDSEHSAIFQCMQGNLNREIKKIYLTASGGPFRGYSRDELAGVSVEQALNHPKWSMGKR